MSQCILWIFPRLSLIFPSVLYLRRPWPRCDPRAMQGVSPQAVQAFILVVTWCSTSHIHTYTYTHIYAGCFATGRAGVHIPIGGAMVCPIGGAGVHIGGVPVFHLTGRSCRSCSCGVTVSRSQHAAHRQAPGTVPLAINFSRPSEVKEFAFVVCTKSFGAGPRLGGPMLLGGCPWCRKEEKGSHLRKHGIILDIILEMITRPFLTKKVMRNKYNSTTRDEMRKLMVGGGILERKVIAELIDIQKDI